MQYRQQVGFALETSGRDAHARRKHYRPAAQRGEQRGCHIGRGSRCESHKQVAAVPTPVPAVMVLLSGEDRGGS